METMPGNCVVGVVDDDESVRIAIRSLLRSRGFAVDVYASAEEFLLSPRQAETRCLIVDVRMPGMSGLDLQRGLAVVGRRLPTIVITAHDEASVRREAFRMGALAVLGKPFAESSLIASVHEAFAIAEGHPPRDLRRT